MWFQTREQPKKAGGGGGGKPRIRLGRTGPRGRLYAPPTKGTTVIAKSKFIKAGKGSRPAIREHLRYIQERERGEHEPERKFFDRDRDGIERKDVYDAMMKGRGDRTAMHTLILSPGDNKINLQEYTRESMNALEERLGHKLDWYAITHENTDYYHSHVTIAGKVPERDRELERPFERIEPRDRQAHDQRWSNEERELRDLLGHRYDERPIADPREDRRAEREFGYGSEREETDPQVRDLLGDSSRTPEEVRAERRIDRYERLEWARQSAKDRGEVWLDRGDLKELRDAGNDYVTRERSLDREMDRAIELEMTRDVFDMDRGREHERTRDDDIFGGRSRDERGRDDDDDDRAKDRGRDDFDRGR